MLPSPKPPGADAKCKSESVVVLSDKLKGARVKCPVLECRNNPPVGLEAAADAADVASLPNALSERGPVVPLRCRLRPLFKANSVIRRDGRGGGTNKLVGEGALLEAPVPVVVVAVEFGKNGGGGEQEGCGSGVCVEELVAALIMTEVEGGAVLEPEPRGQPWTGEELVLAGGMGLGALTDGELETEAVPLPTESPVGFALRRDLSKCSDSEGAVISDFARKFTVGATIISSTESVYAVGSIEM